MDEERQRMEGADRGPINPITGSIFGQAVCITTLYELWLSRSVS